jgi:retron-type reverse transcriptase
MHPFQFLYPFGSQERWTSYLEHSLNWSKQDLTTARLLLKKNLIPICKGPEIATYLGISTKLVGHMVIAPHKYYRTFMREKKSGGQREITAPRIFLKTVQRYILDCILTPLPVHACAVGFVRGRNLTTGAQVHVGHPFLWNIDLKDFFPSIKQDNVTKAFESMGYPPEAAYFLSGLCCLNGSLPQGAPTSPALANIIFRSADKELSKLAKENKIRYTRYADDLSFSSRSPIPDEFRKSVAVMIKKYGFTINKSKSRLMGPRCRREVTGLTVNQQLSIPREKRRQLRAMFHQAVRQPTLAEERKQQLRGYIAWISQYHPKEAARYLEQLGWRRGQI